MGNKGQVAVFIIIALVIVGLVVIFIVVDKDDKIESVPIEHKEVYDYYSSCIEDNTRIALKVAGIQGGRIDIDSYEYGSDYAPFSSHLNFLGNNVQYWYYIAGNGLVKENVPGINDIEREIADYVALEINECDFSVFEQKGFVVEREKIDMEDVEIKIEEKKVEIKVISEINVVKDGSSSRMKKYEIEIMSKFGKMYDYARDIYKKEMQEAFLEGYAVDVLRLYAPVDGVEIGCNPKVWKTREVVDEIKQGLENNIASIKVKGKYYELNDKKDEYFVVDLGKKVEENVNFMYIKEWPSRIEIYGADEELMIAEPIGNQEGLGILGFCYIPYHFVYDISIPVLIQIYENDEMFQFPIIVVIDKNMPRESVYSELEEIEEYDVCEFDTQDIEVKVYDTKLQPIDEVDLDYICFEQLCRLGKTEKGEFKGKAPSCYNGYIKARAEEYAEKKMLFSTNKEYLAEIVLDKEYEGEVIIESDNGDVNENVLVSFVGENSASAALYNTNKIKLSEGFYNVSVYIYSNSSIKIPGTTKRQCSEIAASGILGLFGKTNEQCYDINIDETKIDSALVGGGRTQLYLFEDDLEKGKMMIKVSMFEQPSSLEQLYYNFEIFERSRVDIVFYE